LFAEFALTLAGAIALSTLVALTLSPAMCAAILRHDREPLLARWVEAAFRPVQAGYRWLLGGLIAHPVAALAILLGLGGSIAGMYRELTPECGSTHERGAV